MVTRVISNQRGKVDVVKVVGRIDSSTAPLLKQEFKKITDAGRFQIVVDMRELSYTSSAGLRACIAAMKLCRRFNRGDLRLADMPMKVKAAFDVAGLLELFKVFDNETDAVGSF